MKFRPELGPLVTFVPNKNLPVYSWFYYKEGFSRDFVMRMFKEMNVKPDPDFSVLDPFMGVGTTLVASREFGVKSYGFDPLPLQVFVSKVKTRDYDIEELKNWLKWLMSQRFEKPRCEVSGLVKRAFNPHILDDIIFFRDRIRAIPDENTRDFLTLALISASNKCSYAFKDGAVIKFRKRPVPPLKEMLKRVAKKMISDLEKISFKPVGCHPRQGDARNLDLADETIDLVITSPPYLNKIEYTQVYRIEMELFFGGWNENLISSAIGMDVKVDNETISELGKYLETRDPLVAYKYFKDMKLALSEISRVLVPGGRAIIVIGNGCFPHRVIESDIILAGIAEDLGMNVLDIWIANQRVCTYERVKKVGLMRESVLVLEKK